MNDTTVPPAATCNAELRALGAFLAAVPDCGQDHDIILAECSRLPIGCAGCELNPAQPAP
jgi:hypothetical protein